MNNPASIAFCGIDCSSCVAYLATTNNDFDELQEIATLWGKKDDKYYAVEDIMCQGCTSDILNSHCNVCEVRSCGLEKGVPNCGVCLEYVCQKIQNEWDKWHDANWEKAKQNLKH